MKNGQPAAARFVRHFELCTLHFSFCNAVLPPTMSFRAHSAIRQFLFALLAFCLPAVLAKAQSDKREAAILLRISISRLGSLGDGVRVDAQAGARLTDPFGSFLGEGPASWQF